MSLIERISVKNAEIGIWRIEETVEELVSNIDLSEDDINQLKSFTNEKRKREFLAIRHLLKTVAGNYERIAYNNVGHPLLCHSNQQISISHSSSLAALIISENSVGIDVEEITRNVEKVSGRFLSPEELRWTENTKNKHFVRLICWCAKEAIYKLIKESEVDFSEHIRIFPFDPERNCDFEAEFIKDRKSTKLNLSYKVTENNVVVWSVGET